MSEVHGIPSIALAVRQPWAWAIIHAGKDIENRVARAVTMGGMKPGRIAILASKGMTRDEYESARDFMESLNVECPRPDALIRGAIIGQVTVTDIVKEHVSPWFFGPRGLVLADACYNLPVVAYGQLGYFEWKPSGGLIEPPLPWMIAWPGKPRSVPAPKEPAPAPLLAALSTVRPATDGGEG